MRSGLLVVLVLALVAPAAAEAARALPRVPVAAEGDVSAAYFQVRMKGTKAPALRVRNPGRLADDVWSLATVVRDAKRRKVFHVALFVVNPRTDVVAFRRPAGVPEFVAFGATPGPLDVRGVDVEDSIGGVNPAVGRLPRYCDPPREADAARRAIFLVEPPAPYDPTAMFRTFCDLAVEDPVPVDDLTPIGLTGFEALANLFSPTEVRFVVRGNLPFTNLRVRVHDTVTNFFLAGAQGSCTPEGTLLDCALTEAFPAGQQLQLFVRAESDVPEDLRACVGVREPASVRDWSFYAGPPTPILDTAAFATCP
jgi:hypothetical protein